MTDMSYELAEPRASALIESLRGFGYTPQTAVADLIDNSISAAARNVWIQMEWNGADSYLSICDDGECMSEERLVDAMRLGSQNPLDERGRTDLGRFGLGLKTASFSQCRRLTVRSHRHGEAPVTRRWDLDYVNLTNEWRLLLTPGPGSEERLARFADQTSGTIVLWECMDKIAGADPVTDEKAHRNFLRIVESVEQHLGTTFHRFMERGHNRLRLWINGRPIVPWDPFLRNSTATQYLNEEVLSYQGSTVTVQPYVLPHRSKISDEVHSIGSGPAGWNAGQGFYVYRNERLLVAGDWLGLSFTKEEHYKLARIQLDIPNSMDQEWQIDVRKSRAWPPALLRDDLKRIANVTRERAVSIYRQRGKVQARKSSADFVFVWQQLVRHGKTFYAINRQHPLVHAALQAPPPYRGIIAALLKLTEETIPVPLIAINNSERPESQSAPFENAPAGDVADVAREVYRALLGQGLSASAARNQLLGMDPFQYYPELIAHLENEKQETQT